MPEIFPQMLGLWSVALARGRVNEALALARRVDAIARAAATPLARAGAAVALGSSSFWAGELRAARENLEAAGRIYDADLDRYLPLPHAPVVPSRCQFAWTMWASGYPDQAAALIAEARAQAQRLGRPFSIAMALQYTIAIASLTGDTGDLKVESEALIELSRTHGFPQWIASGEMSLGRVLIEEADPEAGFATLRRGLEGLRASGGDLVYRYGLLLLAFACLKAERFDESLAALDECASHFATDGARMYEAEVLRVRGEVILHRSGDRAAAADCFRTAMSIARAQGAKSWELRTATSLARMLAAEGKSSEARAILSPIYGWFAEGFTSADLVAARSALDSLEP